MIQNEEYPFNVGDKYVIRHVSHDNSDPIWIEIVSRGGTIQQPNSYSIVYNVGGPSRLNNINSVYAYTGKCADGDTLDIVGWWNATLACTHSFVELWGKRGYCTQCNVDGEWDMGKGCYVAR